MKKRSLPLSKVYQLLEPGPVVMLTTFGAKGPNVMTMSWHMMIDFEPPILGCVVSNRDFSFEALRKTKECVISIPTVELASVVVGVGNTSGRNIDKFKKFKLSQMEATYVNAPLIAESYANLECKVVDAKMVNKYNIFIMEVLKAWVNPTIKSPQTIHHCGKGVFVVDGKRIKLPSKMK
jgi:flavin reductase (DIM6/NTAB) family NADH-FMN oxidoreductase RutF